MKRVFALLFLAAPFFAGAQQHVCFQHDPHANPREHNVDFQRMKVEVSFVPEEGKVMGKVTHTFVPLQKVVDSIYFDGPGIKVKDATLDGKPLVYKTSKDGITVFPKPALTWDKVHQIVFEYEAMPKKGIYFIGWNTDASIPESMKDVSGITTTRRQVWTQGQGIDNRHWIPMYDNLNDKFITETVITFDKEYNVLSNGRKVSEKVNKDGTKTWHYAMDHPHAGYLLMLAIDKYAVKSTKSSRGVPVNFWYYADQPHKMEPSSRYTEKMVDFLEDETGVKYPWFSYSQCMVQDFLYGAMENTTATIFGDFYFTDKRAFIDKNYMGVNCHELTHQWFGDFITARSNADTWLQESFATYYPKYFFKKLYGDDHYQWNQRQEMNTALKASEKDNIPVRHSGGGTPRVYPKGSTVISMLRYVLGDEEYKRALNLYLKNHAYANVETNDLYQAIQDKLGITLHWFFDQWLYRGGEPHYQVNYRSISENGKAATEINVKQIHAVDQLVGLFKMPVEFEVHYTDGTAGRTRQWIEKETERVMIGNQENKTVSFVLFDPGNNILKKVTFKKTFEELKSQLLKAPEMIDRYDALLAMKETPVENKRAVLAEAFRTENFYGIRAEIASQLANDKDPVSLELLRNAFSDKDVNVRMAVVSGMEKIQGEFIALFENALKDSSYNLVEKALERLCDEDKPNASRYLKITEKEVGHLHNIRIKWLEIACREEKAKYIRQLVDFTGNRFEFRTRVNAMAALKSLNHLDEEAAKNLVDAYLSWNSRLSGPAAGVIDYFKSQTRYAAVFRNYIQAGKWEKDQESSLKKLNL